MASTSSTERLKKTLQLIKKIKQNLIEDIRSVKNTKKAMNHCLDEMLLFIMQQCNALSDIQDKSSICQTIINTLIL